MLPKARETIAKVIIGYLIDSQLKKDTDEYKDISYKRTHSLLLIKNGKVDQEKNV